MAGVGDSALMHSYGLALVGRQAAEGRVASVRGGQSIGMPALGTVAIKRVPLRLSWC